MTGPELAFAVFGLTSQALLTAFFALLRWAPGRAGPVGMAAYGLGLAGLPLGVALAATGAPLTLVGGPVLMAAWASLGVAVDLLRPRPWRGPPVDWKILVPYVALYLLAQMWLWWPLWDIARVAWVVYLVLFVVNTALNLRRHVDSASAR
jgi:hypothetical protein